MKIIFLDIDGVIIPFGGPRKKGGLKELHDKVVLDGEEILLPRLDYMCVSNIWTIIEETGARIVLSSSWRNMPRLVKLLLEKSERNGKTLWSYVNSSTPSNLGYGRGNEILTYINNYHKTCKPGFHISDWIAIDDDDAGMARIRELGCFVETKSDVGLDEKATKLAISILSNHK